MSTSPGVHRRDPRGVRRIFIDETMVNVGGTPAWIWVAFEPDLRAMPDFHVSWRRNSIDAYTFIRRLCISTAGSRSTPMVPDLHAMLDFHVSWRGNSIDAYLFIGMPVRKYGGIPIYTDGAGWYADACRRAPSARSTIAP